MTPLVFRYHPDPVETGSVVPSDATCRLCGVARGFVYAVTLYGDVDPELEGHLCPWCIADGSAARAGAAFVDVHGVTAPPEVLEELEQRTPSYASWQGDSWWSHCGDAAAFLGPAGHAELSTKWSSAIPVIKASRSHYADWDAYFASLDVDGSPTAYVFQCLHCGLMGGHSDFA